MELQLIISHLNRYLEISAFQDNSANGLQVGNSGHVEKVALAVDACQEAMIKADEAGCNLLIVHHGLFWGKQQLITDNFYQRIKTLIAADVALYAAHLPLDAHSEIGHNIQIAQKIGLNDIEPFAEYNGRPIGIKGRLKTAIPRSEISEILKDIIGERAGFLEFGPEHVQTIGVVAGSASDPALFQEVKDEGLDLYVTGEKKHGSFYLAREMGLNIFYGSHYLTETFGLKALGEYIEKHFNIKTLFIDTPCTY